MQIDLHHRLFTEDPSTRFARSFKCSPNVWREVWKRYKLLDYTKEESREYLMMTLHLQKEKGFNQRFERWIIRTEVYNKAQIAINKEATQVTVDYFTPHQDFVVKEITKNKKK